MRGMLLSIKKNSVGTKNGDGYGEDEKRNIVQRHRV